MSRTKISPSQINTSRNDNGTTGTAPTQREVGWARFAYTATTNQTASISFKQPFPAGVVPVVTGDFAGDSATASAFGSGANTIVAGMTFKILGITNTGFTFRIDSRDGGTFGAGYFFITYSAEG